MLELLDFAVAIPALTLWTADGPDPVVLTGLPRAYAPVGWSGIPPVRTGASARMPRHPSGSCYVALEVRRCVVLLDLELEKRATREANSLVALPAPAARAFVIAERLRVLAAMTHPIIPCDAMPAGGQFSRR